MALLGSLPCWKESAVAVQPAFRMGADTEVTAVMSKHTERSDRKIDITNVDVNDDSCEIVGCYNGHLSLIICSSVNIYHRGHRSRHQVKPNHSSAGQLIAW